MKKDEFKLTEESRYRVLSIGGREKTIETEGIFKGYANIGIDEAGLRLELTHFHGDLQGKTRIVPLHAILCIDVLDAKEHTKSEEEKEANHYYG